MDAGLDSLYMLAVSSRVSNGYIRKADIHKHKNSGHKDL